MKMKVILWIIALSLMAAPQSWASSYTVTIDTSLVQGKAGAVSFDFTSNGPDDFVDSNLVFIFDFTHDGVTGLPETRGGLVQGDIILLANPAAFTSIEDDFFFNQLSVPFTSFGTSITFNVQTTEVAPTVADLPDELSLFILGTDGRTMFNTTDPLGADAIFSLCIDGTPTGLFNVFAPADENPTGFINLQIPTFPPTIFSDGFE